MRLIVILFMCKINQGIIRKTTHIVLDQKHFLILEFAFHYSYVSIAHIAILKANAQNNLISVRVYLRLTFVQQIFIVLLC